MNNPNIHSVEEYSTEIVKEIKIVLSVLLRFTDSDYPFDIMCFAIPPSSPMFCYPSLISCVLLSLPLSHFLLSIPHLPCFAVYPSSPVFCYPSLLSRGLLFLPHLLCFAIPPSSHVFCYPFLLPCFAIPPSSPMFCYPSLISCVLCTLLFPVSLDCHFLIAISILILPKEYIS